MDDILVTTKLLHVPVIVTDSDGIRQINNFDELQTIIRDDKLSWIDISDIREHDVTPILSAIGVDGPDSVWLQRFGQAGRMSIGREKIRAVTWIADRNAPTFGPLTELHFLARKEYILTIWNGNPGCLNEIRHHYHERSLELEKNTHHAVGVVLQLLFSSLDHAIAELDGRLQKLQSQVSQGGMALDIGALALRMQKIQAVWSDVDRYSSAVRTAIVGVEALPGVHERAAEEMNDYAEQVEDVEHRLQDRTRWASDIMQDYATSIAAKQGEQISRLTIVSMIFMPITWLTGFFGMNFDWLNQHLSSGEAFAIFGVALPITSVAATLYWFRKRGLV